MLANPYPNLRLLQEGIQLHYWNQTIMLDWKDLLAVREKSHDWMFWRRDKLTIYSKKLPRAFAHFENFQYGKRKFYVIGDAVNFDRLDEELRAKSVITEAHLI
jgi:hypothetical protein